MSDESMIAARLLGKTYGKHRVLQGLDLTVEPGAAIGLLGANGAGKTTLLKAMLGLLSVDSGRCTILGEPSPTLPATIRARIGYVPQNPSQFPWLTGQAMLRYVSSYYDTFDWAYAQDLADRWKLALRSQIGTLSPGQQQRLSIVRALSSRPDLLILDEPIASLDPATRIAVIDELIAERNRRSMTMVFSSHLIGDLERLCTQFAILADGRIARLEEVQWFRQLVRVSLEGDETVLTDISIPAAKRMRKSSEGHRVIVIPQVHLERLAGALPLSVRMKVDEPDVEAVTSEWMK